MSAIAAHPATGAWTNPEEFVAFFAEGWKAPKPDGFLEFFLPHFHPEVRLAQPLMATMNGHAEVERGFRRLFERFPDYLVEVDEWAAQGDTLVYIGCTHSATIGGRRRSWEGVDRFTLAEGMIRERDAYFDPLPQLPALLRSPRLLLAMPRLLRG